MSSLLSPLSLSPESLLSLLKSQLPSLCHSPPNSQPSQGFPSEPKHTHPAPPLGCLWDLRTHHWLQGMDGETGEGTRCPLTAVCGWSSRAQRKQGESCSRKIKTAAAHVGIESRRTGMCQADQVGRGRPGDRRPVQRSRGMTGFSECRCSRVGPPETGLRWCSAGGSRPMESDLRF